MVGVATEQAPRGLSQATLHLTIRRRYNFIRVASEENGMPQVVEETKNSIRNLPIQPKLRSLLEKAAEVAGVDTVLVTSGGQPPYPGKPRIGSTRHDNGWAADLKLIRNGQVVSFTDEAERAVFEAFVAAAAAHGATGIGAGVDYMGPDTIHVGFGTSPTDHSKVVWGAGGKAATAPAWLRAAAQKGWSGAVSTTATSVAPVTSGARGSYIVVARDGLRLRGGPGVEFGVITTLKEGTVLTVLDLHGAGNAWARVDLEGDGLVDGFVFSAFLEPAGDQEHEASKA